MVDQPRRDGTVADGFRAVNQRTFALALTMSDAIGRPLMIANPTLGGQFMIAGSPVRIVSQFPDVAPGATPVAFSDWKSVYRLVIRKTVTMQTILPRLLYFVPVRG